VTAAVQDTGVDEQLERLRKNWQVGAHYQKRAMGDHSHPPPEAVFTCGILWHSNREPRVVNINDSIVS
jgi:hypothetical protein